MLAGRVGASVTAEIGTMKVTEQIDAEVDGCEPNRVRYCSKVCGNYGFDAVIDNSDYFQIMAST